MVCSVLMCKNRSCTWRKTGLSFHRFPLKNAKLLKTWLRNISRPGGWKPSAQSRICSDHFTEEVLLRVGNRVELKETAVPTISLSFRAKGAPQIVDSADLVSDEEGVENPFKDDHCYYNIEESTVVVPPSVEVAMKEHSYFTGVAPQPPSSTLTSSPPEPQEASEDHTYHTSSLPKPSLDDHTYNSTQSEAALTARICASPTVVAEVDLSEESVISSTVDEMRNFDHTYNHKMHQVSSTQQDDCDISPSKKIRRLLPGDEDLARPPPTVESLLEENYHLRQALGLSELRQAEISKKLSDSLEKAKKLEEHVASLKKTLTEVVVESVQERWTDHH